MKVDAICPICGSADLYEIYDLYISTSGRPDIKVKNDDMMSCHECSSEYSSDECVLVERKAYKALIIQYSLIKKAIKMEFSSFIEFGKQESERLTRDEETGIYTYLY